MCVRRCVVVPLACESVHQRGAGSLRWQLGVLSCLPCKFDSPVHMFVDRWRSGGAPSSTTAATGGVLLGCCVLSCGKVVFSCARSVNDSTRWKRPVSGRPKRARLLARVSKFVFPGRRFIRVAVLILRREPNCEAADTQTLQVGAFIARMLVSGNC